MSTDPANLAAKGAAALTSQDYPAAISYYTQAIEGIPTSADYYIKRSTAHQRSASYPDALADAEIAVILSQRKGKRELLSASQLRRGITLFLMEQYGDAGACFKWAEKYNDKDKSISFWQKKLEVDIAKIPDDDLRREVTVREIPDREIPKFSKHTTPAKSTPSASSSSAAASSSSPAGDSGRVEELPDDYEEPKPAVRSPKPKPPPGVTTPVDKIRHEWYQTSDIVSVNLFVKGVPKESTTVEIEANSATVTFPLPTGSDFNFTLDPLFAPIDPSTSYYKIIPTKVELVLQKAERNKKWANLEAKEPVYTTHTISTPKKDKPPVYPTSSKTGPKNWDKVVDDLAQSSKKKSKDADEAKADDDNIDYTDLNEDDFSSDPVNGFFKKLYKDADPDTRRAMMKSYVESNGTALSTNWGEVKRGKVDTSPPEGMEAKHW